MKNTDNRCFEWAILSKLCEVVHGDHPYRPSKYSAHLGELNFRGIEFPVKISNLPKFERQNLTLSVCVFGWDDRPYPIHESKNTTKDCHKVDLLLLTDQENVENHHYIWVKDLGCLLFKNSNHNSRVYPCHRCMHIFTTKDLLEAHTKLCRGIGEKPQRTVMPQPATDDSPGDDILKFTVHHRQMRAPYIIYADLES